MNKARVDPSPPVCLALQRGSNKVIPQLTGWLVRVEGGGGTE